MKLNGKMFLIIQHTFKIFERKANRMHLYLINLFQLNFPLVLNKQVHHQEVISVLAAIVFLVHLCGVQPLTQYDWNERIVPIISC